MKIKQILIDISFPGFRDDQLKELLENGWEIKDKSIMGNRYIYYILFK
ncbi:MAG: hypothetical protein WC438_06335 [Candidatus Pacearchaeota archaeon]